jgi:hypothetical protein
MSTSTPPELPLPQALPKDPFVYNSTLSKIYAVRSAWGLFNSPQDSSDPQRRQEIFKSVADQGYTHMEMWPTLFIEEGVSSDLRAAGLKLLAHCKTSGDLGLCDRFPRICKNTGNVSDHVETLRHVVRLAKQHEAVFLNAHSGCDFWGVDDCRTYLREALSIEHEENLAILHETHRRRIFYNPFIYQQVLFDQLDLVDVKINLDISHWVLSLGRLFGCPQDILEHNEMHHMNDLWWPTVLKDLCKRAHLFHARIAYMECIQVSDPSADEYENERRTFLESYWGPLMQSHVETQRIVYFEPEHGPWPYQQALPNGESTCDIHFANNYVKKLVMEEFSGRNGA